MSHGSEQSEDYWPGYVDALTSMVQVLAFVMMLLAVTVYVLSKNISKGAVEKIAKAANVSPAPNSSVKELTEKIVQELTKAQEAKSEAASAQGKAEGQGSGQGKGETADTAAKAQSAEKESEGKDQTTINTSQKRTATSATQADQQTEPPPDARNITIKFPERSYRLDPESATALNGFADETGIATGAARVIIRAYAANANGAVTEGRHMAYYRAMVARQALVARKVPSKSIAIRILDTSNGEQGSKIEIYAVPEGAP